MKNLILSCSVALVIISNVFQSFGQTIPSYLPAGGLLAWYPFSGNAIDSSGGGNDGTVVGATLTTDRFGNANSAYLFNGSSTKITTNLLPPLGNAARTITCWFKYNALPDPCGDGGMAIAGYGGSSAGCGQARKNFSLEVQYYYGPPVVRVDGICIYTDQTADSVDSAWHFYAAVYDPSFGDFHDIKLYVDGVYKATTSVSYVGSYGVATDSLSKFEIGKGHYACPRYFDGKIDDIGVWGRALNASELYSLYRGYPAVMSDSFSVYTDDQCTTQEFIIVPAHSTPSLTVVTLFGDGGTQTDTVSALSGYATAKHVYNNTGTYMVTHILYNGTVAIDTATYSFNYRFCRTLPVNLYVDANANCVFEPATETYIFLPSLVEVDSSGVHIDTVSATSGLYYYAYGPVGTVYTFKVLTTQPGLAVSCPSTGIVADTLDTVSGSANYFGMECTTPSGYDLRVFTSFRAGSHHFGGTIIADNTYCSPPPAVLTMQMNPQYNSLLSFIPAPTTVSGNTVTWDISSLSSVISMPFVIYAGMEGHGSFGDTILTTYAINPISGDANASDNAVIRVDTVQAGYDPNDIGVNPAGCLTPGMTTITYTVHFENTGIDTAFNVYVLDTLSDDLDASSMRMITASAEMHVTKWKSGGHTIVKFDFPDINLLDSSYHGFCDGMFVYSINIRSGLTDGTVIGNRAGIYFDYNPVVLTNTIENVIGCPVAVVKNVPKEDAVIVQPNPVIDVVVVKSGNERYTSLIISNSIGQNLIQQQIDSALTKADVSLLPPGLYYVTLKGEHGSVVKKFVKL